MNKEQKQQIIDSGKDFFRKIIIPAHLKNLNELQLKDFNVNPFLIYGSPKKLSANYKTIATTYPVYCGSEFWEHLTGDKMFYHRLAKAFGEVVEEDNIDGSQLIKNKVEEIAKEIRDRGGL